MITALLWTALILSVLTLIAVSSPIRVRVAAALGKSRRASGEFSISYIHPKLFGYTYSSKGRKERTVVFGFTRERKDKGGHVGREDGTDKGDDSKKKWKDIDISQRNGSAYSDTYGQQSNQPSHPPTAADTNGNANHIPNGSSNGDGGYEPLWARAIRRVRRLKDDPLLEKALRGLKDIRRSGYYKILRDKPLRGKVFRWLRRSFKGALPVVSLDKFMLRARVGLRDPAKAGKIYGCFAAASGALGLQNRNVELAMEPVFTEKCLDADTEAAASTTVAATLSWIMAVSLTFPYWRVYRLWRRIKKEGRED
jgi:hypothetical protein